jgi:putative membrane protein
MKTTSKIFAGLVGLQHILIFVVEAFFWQSQIVMERFDMTPLEAEHTATLALNQGFYNAFLAAGLIWSLLIKDARHARSTRIFFFACVVVAGIVGGLTAKTSILFVQGGPALIGLIVAFLDKPAAE